MRRAGIQLCYPFEESRLTRWNPPYIVQPKLDGERCRAIYDVDLGWQLVSSELNTFQSVPHINQALINSQIPHKMELDGELYLHGMGFNEIHSVVGRTVNLHPSYQDIQFHVFDLVDLNLPQWERLRILRKLEERFRPGLHLVPVQVAEDLDGILKAYDKIVSMGYEGIIVRNIDALYIRRRSIFVMKFKPKKEDFYEIIGYKQMIDKDGNPKEMLGALVCQGDDGSQFSVGSGMTDAFRSKYWNDCSPEDLVGKVAQVQYQHITPGKGVPRFPVFVNVVEGDKFVNPLIE